MPNCKLAKPTEKEIAYYRFLALCECPEGDLLDMVNLVNSYAYTDGYRGWQDSTVRMFSWLRLGVGVGKNEEYTMNWEKEDAVEVLKELGDLLAVERAAVRRLQHLCEDMVKVVDAEGAKPRVLEATNNIRGWFAETLGKTI